MSVLQGCPDGNIPRWQGWLSTRAMVKSNLNALLKRFSIFCRADRHHFFAGQCVMSDSAAVPVLTIDGPAGSGKGTVARIAAQRLGWHYLDSGALYRAIGVAASAAGIALDDAGGLTRCAQGTQIAFREGDDGSLRVLVNGRDATDELRAETTGAAASALASIPEVRAALIAQQRGFRKAPGLVTDGRDMGTVIFPDAPYKVFLTASAEERAQRRYGQLYPHLSGTPDSAIMSGLLREILARDARDTERAVAPLRPADGAVVVDTTGIGIDAVVARVLAVVR